MSRNRSLTILFGSQTGTAQDMAEKLYRDSKCWYFTGPVQPMDGYDVRQLIDEKRVIFVCSTCGQGEEPDNMRAFWKFLLRKSLPADSLRGLEFAVLGLGDSSYDKFNFVAKRLNKRLQQLGARPIVPIGLADEQHDMGYSAVAAPWTETLWTALAERCPLANGLSPLSTTPRPYRWHVSAWSPAEGNACVSNGGSEPVDTADLYANCTDAVFDRPFVGTVLSNVRTSAAHHYQDVRLIGLDVGAEISWQPGDVVMLRPCNGAERVAELFALFAEHRLPFDADTVIAVHEIDDEMPVPPHLRHPRTLRTYATQLWNLNATPRPRALELLARHSRNELEREKLIELTTAEGEQDFFDYVTRPRRTIVEVLADFPASVASLRLETVFELFEPIKPRSFSIASSRLSGRLELLVAVVEYRTKLKRARLGLCSNWLSAMRLGDRMRAVIKAGTIRLPVDVDTPIVMVGPGTGLALFRSLLQERQLGRSWTEGGQDGDAKLVLFFGCRNEKADFHCETELRAMEAAGMLKLITAFSRDQEHKIYVQHRIREQSEILRRLLLEQNGWFLLSGNSKNMPAAVREALGVALGGDELVGKLVAAGRYREETWA